MNSLSHLVSSVRTPRTNLQLGGVLAFVAGAVNAGGFLAVKRYTSHMTGIVSELADDLVLGNVGFALAGFAFLLAFVSGAACTALLVNWARRHKMHGEYALPLMLEAVLLLLFGLLGANLNLLFEVFVPTTVLVLCFIMGLQNAIITKISRAEIRTTHMTGIVTDLGIQIGRWLYWNRRADAGTEHFVRADRTRLTIQATIFGLFFFGAVLGALSFKNFGFYATIPIAAALMVLASPPLWKDVWRISSAGV